MVIEGYLPRELEVDSGRTINLVHFQIIKDFKTISRGPYCGGQQLNQIKKSPRRIWLIDLQKNWRESLCPNIRGTAGQELESKYGN